MIELAPNTPRLVDHQGVPYERIHGGEQEYGYRGHLRLVADSTDQTTQQPRLQKADAELVLSYGHEEQYVFEEDGTHFTSIQAAILNSAHLRK